MRLPWFSMNLFSNHYKNLRSVIRNRHSVTRNGDFSKAKIQFL